MLQAPQFAVRPRQDMRRWTGCEWKIENMRQLERISQDPAIMGGKACIRGLRVTVATIVGQVGAGHSIEDVLADYPYLSREDILQALQYAAWLAEEREVVLAGS